MDDNNKLNLETKIVFKTWLLNYLKLYWVKFLILLFLSFFSVVFLVINPWPLKILTDSIFSNIPPPGILKHFSNKVTLLYITAGLYVIIYFFQSSMSLVTSYVAARFGITIDNKLKTKLFSHILHLPVKSLDKLETADYVYRENQETNTLSLLITGSFVTIFQSVITVGAIITIMFFLDWKLALISTLAFPLLYILLRLFTPRIEKRSRMIEEINSQTYNLTKESIENTDIVQIFSREDKQVSSLNKLLNTKLHTQLSNVIVIGIFGLLTSLLTILILSFIIVVGGVSVLDKRLTFGSLLIFIMYAGLLYQPLDAISSSITSVSQYIASLKRVFEILKIPQETNTGENKVSINGKVVFNNVSFGYNGIKVLDNVSFTIEAGEKVAFIGPSGAGKSTILALISRFATPESGDIYIDNYKIDSIDLYSLRNKIGIVTEDPRLFSSTILDNIAFSPKDLSLEDISNAIDSAKEANASEFIEKLPNKYNQKITQSGDSLSGGQKQRVTIARMFFKQPSILLLDEPTSNQDVSNEKFVISGLFEIFKNRTIVLVTHKLSLLSAMDKIFVLEGGKITDASKLGGVEAYLHYLNVHENA